MHWLVTRIWTKWRGGRTRRVLCSEEPEVAHLLAEGHAAEAELAGQLALAHAAVESLADDGLLDRAEEVLARGRQVGRAAREVGDGAEDLVGVRRGLGRPARAGVAGIEEIPLAGGSPEASRRDSYETGTSNPFFGP